MLPALRRAATAGGVIEYRESGRLESPAVVLLHGIGSNSAGFQLQYGPLGGRYRVIGWNAPGYGGSAQPGTTHPRPADYAGALVALLDALRVERAHLVASSWGTLVATSFAGLHPARTRALVLSAPSSGFGTLPAAEREKRLRERLAPMAELGPVEMSRRGAERLVAPGTAPEVLEHIRGFGASLTREGFTRAVRMLFAADGVAQAAALAQPVLILHGTEDRVSPPDQHALRLAAARRAEVEVFPGSGHLLKLEDPFRFNAAVLRFLGEHDGGSPE